MWKPWKRRSKEEPVVKKTDRFECGEVGLTYNRWKDRIELSCVDVESEDEVIFEFTKEAWVAVIYSLSVETNSLLNKWATKKAKAGQDVTYLLTDKKWVLE